MNDKNDFNQSSQPSGQPQLSAEDQRAVDALLEAGFDRQVAGQRSGADRRRVEALANMFGLLKDYPVEDADQTLIHATLARIDRHEDQAAARLSFEARAARDGEGCGGRRIVIPNFVTVAAVLLIGISVLWPLIATMRQRATDGECANNLRMMGYAFSKYAADYNGSMPVAMAGSSLSWDTFQNVRNLEPLVQGHYCEAGCMNCPGHARVVKHSSVSVPSYSYRWAAPGSHMGWGTAPSMTVVLGDLNPVIEAARAGSFIPPLSISINHSGRGQNVLVSDGATLWLTEPRVSAVGGGVSGDNIWLPNGIDQLRRGEQPADAMDVFLTH